MVCLWKKKKKLIFKKGILMNEMVLWVVFLLKGKRKLLHLKASI
jgi:hypothetical protein